MKNKWVDIESIDTSIDYTTLKEAEKFLSEMDKEDKRLVNEFSQHYENEFKEEHNEKRFKKQRNKSL